MSHRLYPDLRSRRRDRRPSGSSNDRGLGLYLRVSLMSSVESPLDVTPVSGFEWRVGPDRSPCSENPGPLCADGDVTDTRPSTVNGPGDV